MEIRMVLPMPISVNAAYASFSSDKGVRRVKSAAYSLWKAEAANACLTQDSWEIEGDGWLEVTYTYYFSLFTKEGKKRIKDVANYEKVLSDFLAEVIQGFQDHKIKRIVLVKEDSPRNEVEVSIKELI